jgi:hypothetical protein
VNWHFNLFEEGLSLSIFSLKNVKFRLGDQFQGGGLYYDSWILKSLKNWNWHCIKNSKNCPT